LTNFIESCRITAANKKQKNKKGDLEMKRFLILFVVFIPLLWGCSGPTPLIVDYERGIVYGGQSCWNYSSNGVVISNNSPYDINVIIYQSYGGSVGAVIKGMPPGGSFIFSPPYISNSYLGVEVVIVANAYTRGVFVGQSSRRFAFYGGNSQLYSCEFTKWEFRR